MNIMIINTINTFQVLRLLIDCLFPLNIIFISYILMLIQNSQNISGISPGSIRI
jgi:hypothetical protein